VKLYLSSYKWGNKVHELPKLVQGKRMHVGVISNAKDAYDVAVVRDKSQDDPMVWKELGFTTEELDLCEYFGMSDALKSKMQQFGLVWVLGGNAFVLRRAFAQSGLDIILPELLRKDEIVYGGFSAGACIMTPTLRGIELCDDPIEVAANYDPQIVWDGLGLVPYSIAPHYKSDHHESALIDRVVEYFEHHNMPYKTLQDGEVIIVNEATSQEKA
jgi:dipeptidase E